MKTDEREAPGAAEQGAQRQFWAPPEDAAVPVNERGAGTPRKKVALASLQSGKESATDPRRWGRQQIVIADENRAFLQTMLQKKFTTEEKPGSKSSGPDPDEIKDWITLLQKERDAVVELHKLVMAAESPKGADTALNAVQFFIEEVHRAATPEQNAVIDQLLEKAVAKMK
jgi:hypothetical protein